MGQWVKDSVLPQLWCRLQLWGGVNPWTRNFHMPQVWGKKKNQGKTHLIGDSGIYYTKRIKNRKRMDICICITESLCCTAEITMF